jgi:membrane-associated protease RseP (regulator of RpoE activity)
MRRRVVIAGIALGAVLLLAIGALAGVLLAGGGGDGAAARRASAKSDSASGKGWLGLMVSVQGPSASGGLLRVASVEEKGPAASAGILAGDLIRSVDGEVVRTPAKLQGAVETKKPGTLVSITYERGDREERAQVKLAEAPANAQIEAPGPRPNQPLLGQNLQQNRGRLGVQIAPVTPELKQRYNLDVDNGVVVTDVTAQSPAAIAGIQAGDVVVAIGRAPINTVEELQRAVNTAPPNQPIDIRVKRGGQEMSLRTGLVGQALLPGTQGLPEQLQMLLQRQLDQGTVTPEQLQQLLRLAQPENVRFGTVIQAEAETIKIKPEGSTEESRVTITPQTRIRRGTQTIKATDLKDGETVLVLSMDGGQTAIAVFATG